MSKRKIARDVEVSEGYSVDFLSVFKGKKLGVKVA